MLINIIFLNERKQLTAEEKQQKFLITQKSRRFSWSLRGACFEFIKFFSSRRKKLAESGYFAVKGGKFVDKGEFCHQDKKKKMLNC